MVRFDLLRVMIWNPSLFYLHLVSFSNPGVCSDSPFGLVAYANSLLNTNVDEAYRLGKLSISLQETFESTDKRPRLQGPVYSFLAFFHEPLQAVVNLLRKNYKDALLAGDTYYAYMSIIFYTRFSMMCGHNLSVLEKECKAFTTQLASDSYRLFQYLFIVLMIKYRTCHVIVDKMG